MAMGSDYSLCFILTLFMQFLVSWGAKDMGLYCGACKAIVDEVEHEISKVDPKKMINVGSFRLDPSGKAKTVKVPYARSETFITELLEDVCTKMNTYAESKSQNGKRNFVGTSSRDGEMLSLSNISISADTLKKLKFAVPFARSEGHVTELLEKVCGDISSDYVKGKDSGKTSLKRMITRDGKMSSDVDFQALMQNAQSSGDKPPDTDSKKVKFICESIIEEHEEDFIKLFAGSDKNIVSKVCAEIGDYCEEEEDVTSEPKEEL